MSEQASSRESTDMPALVSPFGRTGTGRTGPAVSSERGGTDVPGGQAMLARRRPIPPKLYRIGELVDYSGMSRQTIHNYTTMGLLTESCWTGGGHRLYEESVFSRLDAIAEMRMQRRSLQYIRRHFAGLDAQERPDHNGPPAGD